MKPYSKPYWYTGGHRQWGIRIQYRRGRWFEGAPGVMHWNQSFLALEIGRLGLFRAGGLREPVSNG